MSSSIKTSTETQEPFVVVLVTEGTSVGGGWLTAVLDVIIGEEEEHTHGSITSRAVFTESTPPERAEIADTLNRYISERFKVSDVADQSFATAFSSDFWNKTAMATINGILTDVHEMEELNNLPDVYLITDAALEKIEKKEKKSDEGSESTLALLQRLNR